jgi:hypothetical protein
LVLRLREAGEEEDARRVCDLLRDSADVDRFEGRRFIELRERLALLREPLPDALRNCRFAVPFALFALLTIFLRVLVPACLTSRPLAAFPAIAPATPPTIAPIGPAILPTAAPATAPAVCFGIGGMSMFSEDCEVPSSC